jgi:type II secretory pathway pseudopilin PulG
MPVLVVLGVVAVIALIVWGAVVANRKEQARIAELQNLALAKGWQFSAADPYGLPERWEGDPFGNGYDREATNVLTGTAATHPMVAFDYSYKEDSTDSKGNTTTSTYHYAVCALAMPCPLPALHVAKEGVFARLGTMLGMQDIELESEEFNRRFRVRCPDPKLATDVLTPRTMQLLLGCGDVEFRFAGPDVLTYEHGRLTGADLLNRTAMLSNVLAGVPEFVWKDHRA